MRLTEYDEERDRLYDARIKDITRESFSAYRGVVRIVSVIIICVFLPLSFLVYLDWKHVFERSQDPPGPPLLSSK